MGCAIAVAARLLTLALAGSGCGRAVIAGLPNERAIMDAERLILSDKPMTAKLGPKALKGVRTPVLLDTVRGLAEGHKLRMVIGDLRTNIPPGAVYRVHLNLPRDAAPKALELHYAGTINFFAAEAPEHKSERFLSFDVTAVLRRLAAAGQVGDVLTVTFTPDGPFEADAKPSVGVLKLLED